MSIWIVAVSRVLGNITNIWLILAYSSGYAARTALGIWIENRFTRASVLLRIATEKRGKVLSSWLEENNLRSTLLRGSSTEHDVDVIVTKVPRRHLSQFILDVQRIDDSADVAAEDMRFSIAGKTAR